MAVEALVIHEELRRLGYKSAQLAVLNIYTANFGYEARLEMTCGDPDAPPFTLVLTGCTELHLDVYAEEEDLDKTIGTVQLKAFAEVLHLGAARQEFKTMTQVHTELFDLLVAHRAAKLLVGELEIKL